MAEKQASLGDISTKGTWRTNTNKAVGVTGQRSSCRGCSGSGNSLYWLCARQGYEVWEVAWSQTDQSSRPLYIPLAHRCMRLNLFQLSVGSQNQVSESRYDGSKWNLRTKDKEKEQWRCWFAPATYIA